MTILLPAVNHFTKTDNGIISKPILRPETIQADIQKFENSGSQFYIFKDGAKEYLVALNKKPIALLKKYRFVLIKSDETFAETESLLDLATFTWVKHPFLEDLTIRNFTPELVLDSWQDALPFPSTEDGKTAFRLPQIGALHAIQAHWSVGNEAGIVVLPTGTGKTDVMIAYTVLTKAKRLLVIVPTSALRDQLTIKFLTLGILSEKHLIKEDCESPIVGKIQHGFISKNQVDDFFSRVNVAIATMSVISSCTLEAQMAMTESATHLFIDEAHHTPAETWKAFRKLFKKSKSLLFTATPFRNDGKRLEGKIIFNFPLKKAQELEYFRPIQFRPVNDHNYLEGDRLIAEAAVDQLRKDLDAGYDHIIMVRVNTTARATEIFPLYERHGEFNPVLVHSQIKPPSALKSTLKSITARKHRIIVCVDMLGEGFDLPELKIAAFHDTRKSLTVTLQLAGRFTRVKNNLGPATFIANIADPKVHEDLEELYYQDSDWNLLLPDLSYKMSLEQEDFRKFLEGFKGFPDKFPVQSIIHPLSTIIFNTPAEEWKPLNFKEGIKGIDNFDYCYPDYNKESEILIVILGKRSPVSWARIQDFESVDWEIIICYFDKKAKLLYLHASNTKSYYQAFINAICENASLISGQEIFRCFHGINRIRLHNVGVRQPLGRATSYIMRVGSDISRALRDVELKTMIKSNVFGVGFENGSRISVGCSHHGRVWSMRSNNILTWINWCKRVSAKITDPTINPDTVLKGTLIPKQVGSVPEELAFSIEWPDIIYRDGISNYELTINNEFYPIWDCDITLDTQSRSTVAFTINLPSANHNFQLEISTAAESKQFKFTALSEIYLKEGANQVLLTEFLTKHPPLIYFVDGSFLEGNLYTRIEHVIPSFTLDKFELFEWEGIDLRKESQTYEKRINSIQYYLIQKLIASGNYTAILDDDDKGEVADVVAFKVFEAEKLLLIDLYHCKFSHEDTPGVRIADFYVVCGQAQTSIKWMEEVDEIFKHLLRRSSERFKRVGVDRFELGDAAQLEILRRRARKDLKVKINVWIVQPGLSFGDYSEDGDISKLLAVVETYLNETWNADLKVICSE